MASSESNEIVDSTDEPGTDPPTCQYTCFISYSRKDKSFVEKLLERLEQRFKSKVDHAGGRVEVFLDEKDLRIGENLPVELMAGIEERDKLLVVLSKNSMEDSEWVEKELQFAQNRESKEHRDLVLAIGLVPIDEIKRASKPFAKLADNLIADFQAWNDEEEFEKSFETLLKSLSFPSNLKRQLSKYIGLEETIEKFKAEVLKHRLVTLCGPGGSGKTRMAIEIAWQLLPKFDDGIWHVELAGLPGENQQTRLDSKSGSSVPQEVAAALRIVEQKKVPPLTSLVEHLQDKKVLLVLDNCEHVLSGCHTLACDLLEKCHEVTILATSRKSLDLRNKEQILAVPPLSFPPSEDPVGLEEAKRFESVQMFIQRGKLVCDNVRCDETNVIDVLAICHWLQGIPLALELSAARLNNCSPNQIGESLGSALVEFESDDDEDKAHRTLQATIQWSFDLLTEDEQKLFQDLAVFKGWHEDACTEVCMTNKKVMYSLRDNSMMSIRPANEFDNVNRYYFLETIQQFAIHKLEQSGRLEEMRSRHCKYFQQFIEELAPRLKWSDGTALAKLEIERDNLRAAFDWSLASGNSTGALRMGADFWRFWEIRGHFTEGRLALDRLLKLPQDVSSSPFRSKVLSGAGLLAYRQGDYTVARKHFDEALKFERSQSPIDKVRLANCSNDVGLIRGLSGHYDEAIQHYKVACDLAEEAGNQDKLAPALYNIGNTLLWKGKRNERGELEELAKAKEYLEQSLRIFKSLDDKSGQGWALNCLGLVSFFGRQHGVALSYLESALKLRKDPKVNHRLGIAETYNFMARVKLDRGDQLAAAVDLVESLKRMQELGSSRGKAEVFDCAMLLAVARDDMPLAAKLASASDEIRESIEVPRQHIFLKSHEEALDKVCQVLGDCYDQSKQEGRLCALDLIPNLLEYLHSVGGT